MNKSQVPNHSHSNMISENNNFSSAYSDRTIFNVIMTSTPLASRATPQRSGGMDGTHPLKGNLC